jgi:hypothetical protein
MAEASHCRTEKKCLADLPMMAVPVHDERATNSPS